MASPKCPKCGNESFELQEIKVKNSRYRLNAVLCSSCSSVISVLEYFNIGAQLEILGNKLGVKLNG